MIGGGGSGDSGGDSVIVLKNSIVFVLVRFFLT